MRDGDLAVMPSTYWIPKNPQNSETNGKANLQGCPEWSAAVLKDRRNFVPPRFCLSPARI
jgi:hypothetical protein